MARAKAYGMRPVGAVGRSGTRTPADEQPVRLDTALPSTLQKETVRAVQRAAGNRAAIVALSSIQREEPPPAPSSGVDTDAPGRLPQGREEMDTCGSAFRDPDTATYRVIVEPAYGYNCFAWAVGVTARDITSSTIWEVGRYPATLDGWTKYLAEHHGFGRFANGLDPTADLILYGDSVTEVSHAARRAEVPYGRLTFSSKLGGQVKTPVILHAPEDIGGEYGHALRSFWRGPAAPVAPEVAPPTTPK